MPAADAEAAPHLRARAHSRRLFPSSAPGWIILISVIAVMIVATVAVGLRFGLNTVPGLAFIEARANGLKIGRYGKLRIEGVSGDIWRNVSIRRLIIYDEKGTWLEGTNVSMKWRYAELFARRFHADAIAIQNLKVIRRPTLTPKEKSGSLPVTVLIDSMTSRVETLPAFSTQRGLFDFQGNLALQRGGGTSGRVVARSQIHPGDFADITFDLGKSDALLVNAKAAEAKGGALAGAIGLPADQPFSLDAQARGTTKAGAFNLLVTSGPGQPAKADGSWNAGGGSAKGYVRLDASSLTESFVDMLGPQVEFDVAGKKGLIQPGGGAFYDLDARLKSDAIALTAVGPADLGKQIAGPAGVKITAAIPALGRLTGKAVTGGARYEGLLTGGADAFALTGNLQGSGLSVADYSLGGLAGRTTITGRKGEYGIVTNLAGSGGRGSGYAAALLGARPTAELEASRLPDGRLMVKRLRATGSGLKVEASGSRGMLGGLAFKGTADLSNLQAAKIGGKGRVAGSWSADQGGVGKPWVFTVDARGTGLALGIAEVDRMMGAAPRLRAKASLLNGAVNVAEARLDGDKVAAKGAGTLGAKGALAFKLDWNAEGPFRAGPIEVSGKAKGDGAINGSLSAPRADLNAAFDAIDVPRLPLTNARMTLSFMQRPGGGDGAFAMTADSAYGPARLKTDFGFADNGVNLSGLDADAGGVKASGSVALRRGRPSSADLILAAGPGALLTAGTIQGTAKVVDSAGGARATLNLAAKDAVLRDAGGLTLANAVITADGPLDRLPLRVQAKGEAPTGAYSLDVSGLLAEQGADAGYLLTLDGGGKLGRADIKTTETARIVFGGKTTEARLRLASGKGAAVIEARMTGAGATIAADIDDLPLATFNEDLAGRFDAKVNLRGEGERLSGDLDASIRNVRARGSGKTLTLDGTVKARLSDSQLTLVAEASSAQGLKATANLVLPAVTSAAPLRLAIDRSKPVRGQFSADGEIKPLWDLLLGGDRSLSGRLTASGSLAGTLADPRLLGQAQLNGGAFEDGGTGLKLRNVTLAASFADNAIDVSQASGSDTDGGRFDGQGRISLQRQGSSSFRLNLTKFQVIDNDVASATASGQTTINRGADGNIRLEGDLRIDKAQIAADPLSPSGVTPMEVIEINRPGVPATTATAAATEKKTGPSITLAVKLKAARGLMVSGRGLNVELSLDAQVTGTLANPNLSGTARVVRGDYDFAGKRFEFDERGVIYLSTNPRQIRLNLTATREDPSLTAVVRVEGTAAKPEITLTSTPVLPQDEVLSRVLFGSSAAQLSPLEAAQLASALAALAGGGGFDVIGNIRNLAGLDRLTFAGGGTTAMTVAGGKYLTNDVYLELIGGGRDGAAAQVEWRVRRNVSIVSRVGGTGDAKLSVRWRRDY
jgi:translocation and assembly module TamB